MTPGPTVPIVATAAASRAGRVLVGVLVAIGALLAVLAAGPGCALRDRHRDADANRQLVYGALQYEKAAGVFVLTEQSLEADETRPLLIHSDVPGALRICAEVGVLTHAEKCATFAELRLWLVTR